MVTNHVLNITFLDLLFIYYTRCSVSEPEYNREFSRQDTDFIEIISQYNMVCLTEMWSSVNTNVKIKGFEKPFHHFRHKCRKKGCRSGDILVSINKKISLKTNLSHFIGFKKN